MNSSQKINDARPGQPMKADMVNHIIAVVKRMIVDGRGTTVGRMGDQICINASSGPVGNGGGGGGPQVDYTAASKTLLEAYMGVVEYARGRVTAGADQGVVYVRNPANDGWDALNRLE